MTLEYFPAGVVVDEDRYAISGDRVPNERRQAAPADERGNDRRDRGPEHADQFNFGLGRRHPPFPVLTRDETSHPPDAAGGKARLGHRLSLVAERFASISLQGLNARARCASALAAPGSGTTMLARMSAQPAQPTAPSPYRRAGSPPVPRFSSSRRSSPVLVDLAVLYDSDRPILVRDRLVATEETRPHPAHRP